MSDPIYHRSTEAVAPREQFSYWRDAISDAYVPLEPERDREPGFAGRIDGLMLPALRSSTITADAHAVRLSAAGMARRGGAPFFVNLLCHGQAVVSQGGQTLLARPGDVYVVDCDAPWSVDFRSGFSMFCIEMDAQLLRPSLGRRGRLASPVLAGDSGTGRILASYMRLVHELPPDDLLQVQSLMVGHCSDLLSRAQQADPPEASAALTPESACAELGVSRSYLFKILAEGGHTFSGYVRQCRLEACRRLLIEQPKRSVSDIAADWGFEDTSSFHRAFRARFGCAPGQVRR